MIRTGLIGYGLGGSAFHAPLIEAVPGLALAAVVSSRGEQVQAAHPGAAVLSDPQALFADPDIDLVVISTPNDTHVPLAEAALRAGKHVVLDKPLSPRPEQGEALIALARAQGRLLSVFHNRRWDGDFLTVQRLIGDGRLGDVMLYEARWDRFRPAIKPGWREEPGDGAGLFLDLGPHLIDQALQLFGRPEAVSADIVAQRAAARVDDYFEVTLHYGARRAILSAASLVVANRPRFAVHGSGGSFVKFGLDPQEAALRAGARADDPRHGLDDPAHHGVFTDADGTREAIETERGDYRRFYAGVAAAIAGGAPVPVDPADAVLGLRLIALARQSAAEGRRLTV
ncbi:oxidoreductase [Sphingomonas sp. MMS12-HWE2-04]|uniref:oxidoreductase n=1 Tax=Sphingomonas sp. MMS12-HWE2-04 TaxID=3234199 RepID=UPI00384D1CE6